VSIFVPNSFRMTTVDKRN